uniref:Uncharacterized protein n=1 Tax=Siphoviridae sp. ctuUw41 TaxID=2826503 RepID=A0A8S5MZB6_9CAUD|nr:MAG TPA: hypothetical protein [Siphoviridae sp. ctuUw41]
MLTIVALRYPQLPSANCRYFWLTSQIDKLPSANSS